MGTIFGFKIDFWTLWGLFGQFFFFFSFVVQWYHSEKRKDSYLPIQFWYWRILASVILIVYVIVRKDVVFLISLILQMCIYLRNIYLARNSSLKGNPA